MKPNSRKRARKKKLLKKWLKGAIKLCTTTDYGIETTSRRINAHAKWKTNYFELRPFVLYEHLELIGFNGRVLK